MSRILSGERSQLINVKRKPAGAGCDCNEGPAQQLVVWNHTTIVDSSGRSKYNCAVGCGGGKQTVRERVNLVEIGFSVVAKSRDSNFIWGSM